MKYVLALDQGTTSSRAILFDQGGAVRASLSASSIRSFLNRDGSSTIPSRSRLPRSAVALEALAEASADSSDVAAIGITNQRETTIVWNRETGQPVHNAIVWQDRRTADILRAAPQRRPRPADPAAHRIADRFLFLGHQDFVDSRQRPRRAPPRRRRQACFRHRRYLARLETHAAAKFTPPTPATPRAPCSSTSTRARGIDELLDLFRIPASMMPDGSLVAARSTAQVSGVHGLDGIPIAGIAGDQQAALFGQRCIDARHDQEHLRHRMLHAAEHRPTRRAVVAIACVTTVAWKIGDVTEYALEGSVFVGGAVVQWLRDGLGLIRKSEEVEALAQLRSGQWRRLFRPRLRRTGRPALGFLRARLHLRPHSRHHRRTPRPRRAREHRLSGCRLARRHAPRLRRRGAGVARGWRRRRQR